MWSRHLRFKGVSDCPRYEVIRDVKYDSSAVVNYNSRAVVVVRWSACLPSTPMIQVRIPLKPTVFSVKFAFEKNENKQKEA